jgi:23S rRNA (uridine2552-2'-O)-methyltransferase
MSRRWLRDKKKDYYYRRAKAENYRSRAAFKLKQLNKRFKLIRKGDGVVDLGAAPGGWMQVAREIVGKNGFVLGVDIASIEPFDEENVSRIRGDFTSLDVEDEIRERAGKARVVISDASPDISGIWSIDHVRSLELASYALELSKNILKPGGNFLVKVFQGEDLEEFIREVRKYFGYVKVTKPKASRSRSSEVYIIGKRYSGAP